MQLPRLIHQTWKCAQIPSFEQECIQAWRTKHPDWQHKLWTDLENRMLISEHYPWFLETFDNYPYDIQRADAVRYFYMHRFGGIYADIDYEPLQYFGGIAESYQIGLVKRANAIATNFLIFSIQGHPFWTQVVQQLSHAHTVYPYKTTSTLRSVFETTGPAFLSGCLLRYEHASAVKLLDPEKFDPYNRHKYALRIEDVRSMVKSLRSESGAMPVLDNTPPSLIKRLSSCVGIHWRTTHWLPNSNP